jgi:hypothetical protein
MKVDGYRLAVGSLALRAESKPSRLDGAYISYAKYIDYIGY